MDMSRYRLRLRSLFSEQIKLLGMFLRRNSLVKGGIYQTRTKCGKKGCICMKEGKLHRVWRFYRSHEGKFEVRNLAKEGILRYESFTQNYQRFRKARAKLVKIHRRQIETIDAIENELRRQGEKNI